MKHWMMMSTMKTCARACMHVTYAYAHAHMGTACGASACVRGREVRKAIPNPEAEPEANPHPEDEANPHPEDEPEANPHPHPKRTKSTARLIQESICICICICICMCTLSVPSRQPG